MEKSKTNEKIYKFLKVLIIVLFSLAIIIFSIGRYMDKRIESTKRQLAMSKIPSIESKINTLVNNNHDIDDINYKFEYKGTNFIELYVKDTWFNSTDIEKKRFAKAIQENVKSILFEEGFINPNDRLGIYVFSVDGISLAESNFKDEIRLKD